MRKTFTLLTAILILSASAVAQTVTVNGSVNDPNEGKSVQNAVIALLTPKDSVLYKFTRTDAQGKYRLKDVKPGDYILMTTHPYFADLLDNISIKDNIEVPQIGLISKVKLLQEVIINTGSPIKIRGDTTIYTADSFKVSANANVEELLKKLPGIQVDKNGVIKAMGQTVQKVLVDGEEFFGDDPGMAVKNLRADAVKEVRVFDKKSDQAEFTGIDDGKTQKTIDLRLKEDKKKGYFGKIDVSGGPQKNIDHRYNNNLLISSFKGKRKLSAFLLNGNTGQDGLSWQDQEKYGGGNDNFSMNMDDDGSMSSEWRGNSSDDEPYFDPQNGFITNVNAGAQYSNKWNDKHNLNLSPKYNFQDYDNHKLTFRQTQIEDSVLNENADDVTHIKRYNFRNRLVYDIKLDSNNSFKLTGNANFYHTESDEKRSAVNTGNDGTLKNTSDRMLQTNGDKVSFSGNLIFRHKFKKLRRTLTATADWNTLNNEGKNFLQSTNQAYLNGIAAGTQKLNQMKDYDRTTNNLSAKLIYTEPLSKEYSLELGYQLAYTYGNNDQLTYSYSPVSGKYDFAVDSLSNMFRQNIIQHIPSGKINFTNKKFKINLGSGFGLTNFELHDLTMDKEYKRSYVNFFPAANITYTYKPNRSVRFNYNGNTRQPTIDQLQPLRNNNDYFNQYIGNPDLKPSFINQFNVNHFSYNFIKDVFMYQNVNVRLISNSITQNRTINVDSGKTITQPINTNGNVSINAYTGYGFKIKKLDLRIDLGPNFNYSKYADVINSNRSFSKNINTGIAVNLQKGKEKKYDASIRNEFSYNSNTTSQNDKKIHYYTNRFSVNGTIYYKKTLSLTTDYTYFVRQKAVEFNSNLNSHFWNARLERTFKSNEFSVYIDVRDILNQNIGIDRNFYGNTYTEVKNDRLKRFFFIGFRWDFKNKGAATK